MSTKKRVFEVGSIHHIYNRAANKVKIFSSSKDYDYFISKVWHFGQKVGVGILAYSILPNHYHFILVERRDSKCIFKGSCKYAINQFILRLEVSYARRLSLLIGHSGAVFQGPFKSREVFDRYEYDVLLNYVLMNPVKHKIVDKIDEWDYTYFDQAAQP